MNCFTYARPLLLLAFLLTYLPIASAQPVPLPTASNGVAPRVTQPVDETKMAVLSGNVHPLALPDFDRGAAPDNYPFETIYLVLRRSNEQEAELQQAIANLHNPGSPSFHQWMTPTQFGSRFGPADSDVQAVTAWLSSHGLHVAGVNQARTFVKFSGTAGQLAASFHSSIHEYMVDGETHHANTSDPQVPAALLPVIAGVSGLNDFQPHPGNVRKGSALYNPKTDQVDPAWTDPSAPGRFYLLLAPADFAGQYSIPSTMNGAGITIGIIGLSDVDMSLVAAYRSLFNLDTSNLPTVVVDGTDPGFVNGADGKNYENEAYLDLEVSGSVAPASKILFYVSGSLIESATRAVDDNAAAVMSISFLNCENNLGASNNAAWNLIMEQAAAQGQTVMVSSGDSGPAGCDDHNSSAPASHGLGINGIASSPYNIAVGGTDFYYTTYATDMPGNTSPQTNTELKQYWDLTTTKTPSTSLLATIPEQPWNVPFGLNLEDGGNYSLYTTAPDIEASGGGVSSCAVNYAPGPCSGYPKPSWQTGFGPANTPYRTIPDVSLYASGGSNYSSYPTCSVAGDCTTNTTEANGGGMQISRSGGTSASSPAFAGIMALVNQATGSRQGQANYVLYALAMQHPEVFRAITVGSNNVPCVQGSPNCSLTTTNSADPANGMYSFGEYNASAGYNLATGLGSINVAKLLADWDSIAFAATSTSLSSSTTSFQHGTGVTLNVATTSASGTPAGQIAILNNTGTAGQEGLDQLTLGSNGTVSSSINSLPGGSYNVVARYGGNGEFSPSTSNPVSFNVTQENSQTQACVTANGGTLCGSSNPTYSYGTATVISATPASAAGKADGTPTGTVVFTDSFQPTKSNSTYTNVSASIPLSSFGSASWQSSAGSVVGTHSLTAAYSGDSSFYASASQPLAFTTSQATSTIAITTSSSYSGSSGSIALSALVSGTSIYSAPTGSVTFSVNGTVMGTATLSSTTSPSSGVLAESAQLTVPEPTGVYIVSATYSGDTNFAIASASPVSVTVAKPGFQLQATPVTIATSGGSGSSTILITPVGSFTGQVNLTCALASTPASDWSSDNPICTLVSSSVTIGSNPASITATFSSTAAQSLLLHPQRSSDPLSPATCGFGLFTLWLAAGPRRGSKFLRLLLILLLSAAAIGLSSCSSKNPGTTQGTYTYTISGSDQATGHITNTTTITLTMK
jgi:hypothetical protein